MTPIHLRKRLALLLTALTPLLFGVSCEDDGDGGGIATQPGETVNASPTPDKVVALTYDDGPNGVYTSDLLNVLRDKDVRATFFLVGKNTEKQPDLARRIQDEGHVIGNHSYSHPHMGSMSLAKVEQELDACADVLETTLGRPTSLFRPPWGEVSDAVTQACVNKGYSIILWSVTGRDWDTGSARAIADNVLDHAHPGAIILLHDGKETDVGTSRRATVEATGMIIDELRAQGYRFATVPELL